MCDKNRFAAERDFMVSRQMQDRGIKDTRVLEAFRSVPRHCFVLPEYETLAYEDYPLKIGNGQTISQPYIVALMTSLLELEGNETVLEIGTGSGYQAAILGYLAKTVHTIERFPRLVQKAQDTLNGLGYINVEVHEGDGSQGWQESAPYEGILVTAAAPYVPKPLLKQLADGGRLIIPVGSRSLQNLEIWYRKANNFKQIRSIPVAFVPLRGKFGWSESEW